MEEIINFIMQRIQNSQKYFKKSLKVYTQECKQNISDERGDLKHKSVKFNRKSQSKNSDKKKQQNIGNEHRIFYISPTKQSNFFDIKSNQNSLNSPIFCKGFQRFSLVDQKLLKQNNMNVGGQDWSIKLQQKDGQINNLKLKIQQYIDEIQCIKRQNKFMRQKLTQYSKIQQFLIERQTFISQILQNNILLNQNINRIQTEKRMMEDHFSILLQEKLDFQRNYQRQSIQWIHKLKIKNQEIQKLFKINKRLQIELSQKIKTQKQVYLKENIRNLSNQGSKLLKSKSQSFVGKAKNEGLFNARDMNRTQDIGQFDAGRMSKMSQQGEEKQNDRLIKNLQEKIRYSEIQIDILKKVKQDSLKLSKNNDNLKSQNRKLLNRINMLNRKFSRKGQNSDSSLELSLSPAHQ